MDAHSESHQRQLLLFGENPDNYLSDYSKEFEKVLTLYQGCILWKIEFPKGDDFNFLSVGVV